MACVNNSMKIDSDIEMIIENLESRGFVVDKLLRQHLIKVSKRLSDSKVEIDTRTDADLSISALKLERPTSGCEVKKCPRCQSSMVRPWFKLKCVNDICKYLE